MQDDDTFELSDFLPYLLNRAAEETSLEFSQIYKTRYSMLRTEWRVLVHLGRYGPLTAKQISDRSGIHKTKISRAVRALESKRIILRDTVETDRRSEVLRLSRTGRTAYEDLVEIARVYDRQLASQFTARDQAVLRKCLRQLAKIDT